MGHFPKRILIVQLGPVHEVIQTLPLLNTLRFRFPRCEIAILIDGGMIGLMTRHPAPDRIILAPPRWHKSFEQIRFIRKRLKAYAPDLCFEPEGSFAGMFASWLSGAKNRIGFSWKHSRSFFFFLNNRRLSADARHPLEQKLQLLESLGIVGSSVDYDLPTVPYEEENARNFCHAHDLLDTPFLLIHAMSFSKNPDLWKTITNHIGHRWNIPQMLLCMEESDIAFAEELVRETEGAATATPKLSLPAAIALMRKASFFISADIGTLHLACATQTPCVGILNSSKEIPPFCNDPLSHWVDLSMGLETDILFACDRIMEKLLAKDRQRRGA